MTQSCPLCGNPDVTEREHIRYATISTLYRRQYGIEVQPAGVDLLGYLECQSCGLLYFQPMVVGDARLYEQLQVFPWYYLKDKSEFQVAASFIRHGHTVIEVGGGEGNFATHLPRGARYIGIEFNDEAVKKARAKKLDVSKLSLQEFERERQVKADIVCAFQVLEHVADPRQFISDMLRLLKPGGLLAISVPSEDSFMAYELNNVLNAPPHHYTRWTDATLNKTGEMFGLELLCLDHERPSAQHIASFAQAEFFRLMERKFGLRVPMFSLLGDTWFVRKLLSVLSRPLRKLGRDHSSSRGHTVTVVFRTATACTS